MLSKREEQTKQRQLQMEQERLEQINNKLTEMGIADFNHDTPPDEVDEASVQRSTYKTLISMIPYTNAWYEAKAAEDEMDGLKAIRIEKTKASDLLALAKIPNRSEEALRKLMSETNNDFHYFNRLRTKLESEGKFVPFKPAKNMFKDAGGAKNRVKKAFRKNFSILDHSVSKSLNLLSGLILLYYFEATKLFIL
jgi:hypothetical protein